MNIKKIVLGLLGLFMTVTISADNAQNSTVHHELIVWQKDGNKMTYDFSSKPRVTTIGTLFVITTSTMEFLSFEKVLKFTVRKVFDGSSATLIEDQQEPSLRISETPNGLLLSNCEPNTDLAIFRDNGMLVFKDKVDSSGSLLVSMDAWPTGIYIFKSNKVNLKVVKK